MNDAFVYNGKQSSYKELLIIDGTISVHHRNIKSLPSEMFKVKNQLYPENILFLRKELEINK